MADIIKLNSNGSSQELIDITFVAEGYTAAERDKFISDAQHFSEYIFSSSNSKLNDPFYTYAKLFNSNAVFVASKESGLDQPNSNIYVNTFFDASQHGSDGRGVYGDSGKVISYLNNNLASNAHDIVVVLVNSTTYGGTGGPIAFATSGNVFSKDIIMHELGHTLGHLQDEYVDTDVAKSFSLLSKGFLDSVHVTDSLNRIPWSAWLGYTDDLGTVGTYKGGFYRSTGVWRATQDSKMFHLNQPYSAPEKEGIICEIYKSIGDYLSISRASTLDYFACVPDARLFNYSWKIGDLVCSNQQEVNIKNFIDKALMGDVTLSLSLKTQDETGLVKTASVLTSATQSEQIDIFFHKFVAQEGLGSYSINMNDGDCYYFGKTDDLIQVLSSNSLSCTLIDCGAGNDTIIGGVGNDYISGGASIDTARYLSTSNNYTITPDTNGFTVIDKTGANGTDTLSSIERLQFTDTKVAIDINGNAGTTAKILGAVFGASSVSNQKYVGIGLSYLDGGMSYQDLMQLALTEKLGAGVNDPTQVVNLLYANLVGVAPDQANLSNFVGLLNSHTYTTASLGVMAAEASLNTTNINLVGLAQAGIHFI